MRWHHDRSSSILDGVTWRVLTAIAASIASISIFACEGLIGADFSRTLRIDFEEAGNDAQGTDGAIEDDASLGPDGARRTDGAARDARLDALTSPPKQCGDVGGLDPTAPWPMTGFCPSRPNRSPAPSLASPQVRRRFTLAPGSAGATMTWFGSGVALDANGAAYALVTELVNNVSVSSVVAIGKSAELWRTPVPSPIPVVIHEASTPVLAANGAVYCASGSVLFTLTRAGAISWSRSLPVPIGGPPLVLGDGTVVVVSGPAVRAFTSAGADAWTFANDAGNYFVGSVTATPAGALLVVRAPSVGLVDALLDSFNPNGTLNWTRTLSFGPSSVPLVDDQGRIVVRSYTGISVFSTSGTPILTTSTLGGGDQENVFPAAISSGVWFGDGKDLLFLDGVSGGTSVPSGPAGRRGPVIATASDDVVFVIRNGTAVSVVSLAPDGSERWSVPVDGTSADLRSAALSASGEVFAPVGPTLFVLGP